MKKKTRYEGKRIVTYSFPKQEVINILEDVGKLRGLGRPTLLFYPDRADIEYIFPAGDKKSEVGPPCPDCQKSTRKAPIITDDEAYRCPGCKLTVITYRR